MSYLIKDGIHGVFVDAIYNEIFSKRANYYYFIGKVIPWDIPTVPDIPVNTQSYEYDTRNNIISIKKIQISDVSYVVPRRNWVSGIVYDQFDGDYSSTFPSNSGATSLKNSTFYVLTTEFNVYKCIFNNNNSPSVIEPSGTDPITITTSDGYVWKYMYTIPLSIRNRFLTETVMPVQKAVYNSFYSNGEVDRVIVDNYGSGYYGNLVVTLRVNGTFKGATGNSIANLIPVFNQQGSITAVKIKNAGNNYVSANISVIDNDYTGNSFYKGLANVTIVNVGAGYTNAAYITNTTATISTSGVFQPNSNATLALSFNNNSLVGVRITNNGSGYTAPAIANTVVNITTTGVFQPTTNANIILNFANSAILTPVILDGKIDRVLINDPGVGYRSNIQTVFSLIGDGTGASFTPYINESGQLEDVIIESRGQGYTYLDVDVVGDGTGANVQPFLSTGDLDTLQSTVELAAAEGAIHAIRILNRGNNYTSANIVVTGDGSGFAGTVILSNTNTISYINVTNPGSGYTYANVQITGNGSNAEASAIMSPIGGHGSDAVKELFADTLMFYSTINNETIHSLNVDNDYRQFGIIRNPKQFNNDRLFANVAGTPCILLAANTVINALSNTLQQDTILELSNDSTRKYQVIDVDEVNSRILINPLNNKYLTTGNVLYDPITDSNFPILTVNSNPTINKFSGELLFIDNRTKVSYSDQQLVTLKTTIKL
jgi:hypothetical protein